MRRLIIPALIAVFALGACADTSSVAPTPRQAARQSPAEFCAGMGRLATVVMLSRQEGMSHREATNRMLHATQGQSEMRKLSIGILNAVWQMPVQRTASDRARAAAQFGGINRNLCMENI